MISPQAAYLLTDAMEDVVTKGTGGAAAVSGQHVAGKTGTTSSNKDVWFAGYTPYYTATVWAGYDNNLSLEGDEKNFHKKIWKNIMTRVHEGLEGTEFEQPEGIVTASVCKKSGKLARSGYCDCDPRGSQVITEKFAQGTVPTEYCDTHVRVNICAMTGSIAGEYCPFISESRVYILRPDSSYSVTANGSKVLGTTADSPYQITSSQISAGCALHGGTGSVNAQTVDPAAQAAAQAAAQQAAAQAAAQQAAEQAAAQQAAAQAAAQQAAEQAAQQAAQQMDPAAGANVPDEAAE